MADGRVTIDVSRCKGCELCINFCPTGTLILDTDILNMKGYHTAGIGAREKCTGCGICALMCPDAAIVVERGDM